MDFGLMHLKISSFAAAMVKPSHNITTSEIEELV
jgi:hypothetical protein